MRSHIRIKEETDDQLLLVKEPGLYGYALLAAFTAIGYGAASYSQDHCLWQLTYISFGVFLGLACIDDFEECHINKKEKEVKLIRMTVWDKIYNLVTSKPPHTVVFGTDDIIRVHVKEETVTYFGKGYQVVMFMNSGIDIGVTESYIFGNNRNEPDELASKIKTFLNLTELQEEETQDLSDDSSSGPEDDDFEYISKDRIEEELKGDTQTDE